MAGKELTVIITAQDGASRVFTEVSSSAQEAGNSVQRAGEDGKKGVDDLSSSVEDLSANFDEAGKAAGVLGGAITAAFVGIIGTGASAMWDQVSAVEQATVALQAYESDADAVSSVLEELIGYARSDMGVLFNRTELFESAQALKLYGAETENLAEYVEILSRSVGLGLSNWDDLNRIIGRVGSTGRLVGNDFDYLIAAGFRLDESLRNTNLTWDELFAALDAGMPANALEGQANTIEGMMIRLQSAIRDVGAAFLGVDTETTQFIEGGLGASMRDGLGTVTDLLGAMETPARMAGEAFGTLAGMASDLAYAFLSLPDPIQDAITGLAGFAGGTLAFAGIASLAIPRIVSMVASLKALPAAIRAATMAMGPVGWIITGVTAALTVGAAAWGSYRRRVDEASSAIEALEDARAETGDFIVSLPEEAAQSVRDELDAVQQVIADFTTEADQYKLNLGEILMYPDENQGQRLHDGITDMLDSSVGGAFLDWAEANQDSLGEGVYEAILNREHLDIYGPEVIDAFNSFLDDLVLSVDERTDLEDTMRGFWQAVFEPDVDTDGAIKAYQEIFDEFERTGNVEQFNADMQELTRSLEEGTFVANAFSASLGSIALAAATPPIAAYREELDRTRETISGILELTGHSDLASRINLVGMGNDATMAADGLNRASASLDTMYRVVVGNTDGIAKQSAEMESWITSITAIEEGESRLLTLLADKRITQEQYNAAIESSNVIQAANAQIQEDVLAIQAQQAPMLAANTEAMAGYVEEIRLMNDGTVEGMVAQMEALAWMDDGLQGQVAQTLDLVAHLQTMGDEGEAAFRAMADSAAATNPYLFTMYETLGLVTDVVRDESGRVISYEVNLDGADGAMSEIALLTQSIETLTEALYTIFIDGDGDSANEVIRTVRGNVEDLDGTTGTVILDANGQPALDGMGVVAEGRDNLDGTTATINVGINDMASGPLGELAGQWAGSIATSYIDVITRHSSQGRPGMALGGVVQEYASGGVVIRAGEVGPEIAHFANGGTALLPHDGLYSVPPGTYITPNHAVSNSYGGDTVFNITVNGGDADQIKRVFTDEIVPGLTRAVGERRVGMGAS